MKLFIISLKRRQDRRNHIEMNYPKLSFLDKEIIDAYDGKYFIANSVNMNNFCIWVLENFSRNNKLFPLKFGEVGCLVSHLYIWKKMVEKNIEKALILEDDIMEFDENYKSFLNEITLLNPKSYNIIYLNRINHVNKEIFITDNIYYEDNSVYNRSNIPGTFGYVISKKGAEIFLDNFKTNNSCGLDILMYRILKGLKEKIHFTKRFLVKTPICQEERKKADKKIFDTDIQIKNETIKNFNSYIENIKKCILNKKIYRKFYEKDHVYLRPLHSGLGDRFGVLLGCIALSRLFNCKIYYHWTNDRRIEQAKKAGRYYPYDKINESINWPNNFVLVNKLVDVENLVELRHQKGGILPCTSAYDCIPNLIPFTFDDFALDKSLLYMFLKSYYEVCDEFDIKIGNIPKVEYMALHIRGTDKKHIGHIEKTNEILKVLYETYKLPIVIVTDDNDLKSKFFIQNILNFKYSKFDNNVQRDLYDFKLLMNSKFIIQYSTNGWSAFSNIASCIRKIPLLNISSGFSRIDDFRSKGNKLDYWFKKEEVLFFIQYINERYN